MNPLSIDTPTRLNPLAAFTNHAAVRRNPTRSSLIDTVLEHREALVTASGALATWNPAHSTGRIPKDTYIVRDEHTTNTVDWTSSACQPIDPTLFDELLADAITILSAKEELIVLDRTVGHDSSSALGVTLVTDSSLLSVFADNMFCADKETTDRFTILALPKDVLPFQKYGGRLREENGMVVSQLIAMDFTRRIGLIVGTQYCGCLKKMMFTVMNHHLPQLGILPLHCSANEGPDGSAIFLGLSGTGKTTLSNDPTRTLIGDDEHGWNDTGIFNMEGGCYAKMIDLDPEKEPDIYQAIFRERSFNENGCIIENAMVYPDGTVDTGDSRLTLNSRASYPLHFLSNTKQRAVCSHPHTIIFLTADASGVLPPVAQLDEDATLLWFLMGYTSKLAGTEIGVTKPVPSFSRFFGAPFMPGHPHVYVRLLAEKIRTHGSSVYLINTGWTGGPYGVGKRFDIRFSRKLVNAALSGELRTASYRVDERFKLNVPTSISGVDGAQLDPSTTWNDCAAYDIAADMLAQQFADYFDSTFRSGDLPASVCDKCPRALA